MVREGRKCSESVRRGSSIGHECQNMRPEPGVAHQHTGGLIAIVHEGRGVRGLWGLGFYGQHAGGSYLGSGGFIVVG